MGLGWNWEEGLGLVVYLVLAWVVAGPFEGFWRAVWSVGARVSAPLPTNRGVRGTWDAE